MKIEKLFSILLLTVCLTTSSHGQTYSLTAQDIKNIRLAYDSLDECKEASDSLRAQITSVLNVVSKDSAVILNLRLINSNQAQIISGKDILITSEKKVSSSLRRKSRLYALFLVISIAFNAYQIVR